MLEHGGKLRAAAQHYGIPYAEWLDLSTGINPHPYAPPAIPLSAWQRLPEDNDGLEAAAASYYGNAHLLALAGSQAAIQALPRLFAAQQVAYLSPIYNEHIAAWQNAGHTVSAAASLAAAVADNNIVVLCNPNNPDGRMLTHSALLEAAQQLQGKQGWLIIDEAFIDADNSNSLTALAGTQCSNLIVLRSLGKFFGLAGARVGFVFAAPSLLQHLAETLGPWALSHPARIVASAALQDSAWQAQARSSLIGASQRLAALLAIITHGKVQVSGTALFQYLALPQAEALHEHLAQRGILTRLLSQPAALRLGLPTTEAEWQRLTLALTEWNQK